MHTEKKRTNGLAPIELKENQFNYTLTFPLYIAAALYGRHDYDLSRS